MDVYTQSLISLLDLLFVYINVMHSWLNRTGNTSTYEGKNYEALYIFRFGPEKFYRMVRNSSCTMIVLIFVLPLAE
jgi:hypothetical protein